MVVSDMDSMYLDNLDEYINDEGKIVTYKYLSLSLKVHANIAKQMLYEYVSKRRSEDKGDELRVTYLVSGIEAGEEKQQNVQKMVLVTEENLSATKSKMKKVISVHIYSVAKSKIKDLSTLYTANYDEVKKNLASINKYSGVECPSAQVQSAADLELLQKENAYKAPEEPVTTKKPPKPEIKKENTTENNKKQDKKPSNQIASMFARQSVKSEEKKEDKKTGVKKPSSAGSQKKGGISAFLSKVPSKQSPTPNSSKSSPVKTESSKSSPEGGDTPRVAESLISSVKTESQDTMTSDSQPEKMEVDSPSPRKAKKIERDSPSPKKGKTQAKLKPNKASQKRGKSKRSDDESPIPKRKRIMAISDSESSSEEENEEEESPIPEPSRIESDEEDSPPIPVPEPEEQQISSNGKPKKRKLVPKTFRDEDGFLVTKKEYEYVSDSDTEEQADANQENIPAKRNVDSPKKASPQKKASPKSPVKKATAKSPQKKQSKDTNKTKQSSIMSFFSKK